MIKNLFILISIGIVPSIITKFISKDKVIINIDQKKHPKIYEILNTIGINIKHYKLMTYELDAIE